MKGNQHLPNKQVISNNSFSYRSRSNSRDRLNNSRHRGPNKSSHLNSKPYYGNSNFKPPSFNRDGNCSRRPFSRKRLHNVRNYINSLLDQGQTDDTMSNTENTATQNVSEENLLEQQIMISS